MGRRFDGMRGRWCFGLAMVTAGGVVSAPVYAQSQEEEPRALAPVKVSAGDLSLENSSEQRGGYTLGATVSATGLLLSPRETPQSVSIVTREQIEDQGLVSTREVLEQAPGVSMIRSDSNRYAFSSRGFSIRQFQFDGLLTPISNFWNFGATDLDAAIYDRVEVIRGATGLMSGAGEPSALVNFVRKRPGREFAASGAVSTGSWDARRAELDLTMPLTEDGRVSSRVVAVRDDSESYMRVFDDDRRTLYGVISAELSPSTLLVAGVEYQDNHSNGMGAGFPMFYSDGSRTDFPRSVVNTTDWSQFGTTSTTGFMDLTHALGNGWQLRGAFSYNDGDYDMEYLFRGGYPDPDTGEGMTGSFLNYRGDRQYYQMHLTATGPVEWFGRIHEVSLGWMRVKDDYVMRAAYPVASPDVGSFFDWRDSRVPRPVWGDYSNVDDSVIRQNGGYVVTRLSLADPLHAILGARISQWEIDQVYFGTPTDYRVSDEITPYAGLIYDLNDVYSAYASYTQIFQPQNNRDPQGDLLDPIHGNSQELGLKAGWAGGRLTGAVSVFRTEQDNLAEEIPGVSLPGQPDQPAYRATSGATVEGVDLELTGELTPHWHVSTSYTHFTAKDADGQTLNRTQPRSLFKLFTRYQPPVERRLTLGAGVDWQSGFSRYTSSRVPVVGRTKVEQGSYALVNVMARYQITPELSATVRLNNAFDKTYYTNVGFYDQAWWGEPRNVTLSLRMAL
ncbi:TonB-dependent siderophore receptor family protein 9 [Alcanivorax xiamenensis]|uniref:TonB-dependent siderophore receptor family protein 9 n=1 Tax=Alcanivorax xiamenensis TaxID=1177156 RepID=A0ABQ6Y6G1_9GAMM|nr:MULTISPECIES: TonB-dependent siderophore receptor [Alcanivorax]KAF0804946.1 TonB-dependent siderophore receptor family protein 9 [Alcanivorax xiamenensis]